MTKYSSLERKIAFLLRKFPKLRYRVKKIYQKADYLQNKKNYAFRCDYNIKNLALENKETFFGYYDKSPISSNKKFIIYHSTNNETNKKPLETGTIDIVIYSLNEKDVVYTIKTRVWNWQQGTRLQWLTSNQFAFNDFDAEKKSYIARVYGTESNKELKRFEYPVQDAFKDEYFLSLNYRRLNTLRPDYGYKNLPNLTKKEVDDLTDDGIWYVDYQTGEGKLIIKLENIVDLKHNSDFKDCKHYVNHIMISPNGDKFIFLHRYFKNGVRFDRLILSDLEGKMKLLCDHDMVSHCCWLDNDKVIGFLRHKSYGDSFYKIDVNSLEIGLLSDKLLNLGDGHPSVINDFMIFDSYPDRSRMKKLFIYNLKNDTLDEIGEFFESMKYFGETRCDLHPKWSYDGSKIFIDSVHEGKRKLYDIDVRDINI